MDQGQAEVLGQPARRVLLARRVEMCVGEIVAIACSRMKHRSFALSVGLVAMCSGCQEEPLERTLRIVTGLETDTFTASPAVTKVRIEVKTASGETFAADAVPGGSFDLGELPIDEPLGIEVTGTSADGLVVVRGRSLAGVLPSAFASEDIPVFVQRLGTWARPPGRLDRAHVDAPACVLGERYVATTGGLSAADEGGVADARDGDFYDLLAWNSAGSGTFPVTARSLVGRIDGMLVVGDAGASFIGADGSQVSAQVPSGLSSYADVAGGLVVESPSGTSYVVGAARETGATQGVLGFGKDGLVSALSTVVTRTGAASAWAAGVGLVVVGGSATGAGFEVVPEGQTAFVTRDMPPDATVGAAAVTLGQGRMVLIGGVDPTSLAAPTRTWDPSCMSACAMTEIADAELPVALIGTRAFSLGGSRVLVVGREVSGDKLVRIFEVDVDKPLVVERPLRESRSGATAVPAPNGTLAIMGGVLVDGSPALTVEMYFP